MSIVRFSRFFPNRNFRQSVASTALIVALLLSFYGSNVSVSGQAFYWGPNWKRYPGNPVVVKSQKWEFLGAGPIYATAVLKLQSKFVMLYDAMSGNIFGDHKSIGTGLAESTDGITWTKYDSNPVMVANSTLGKPGLGEVEMRSGFLEWDESSQIFNYWYTVAEGSGGITRFWIRFAQSTDLLQWRKIGPVFLPLQDYRSFAYPSKANGHFFFMGGRFLAQEAEWTMLTATFANSTALTSVEEIPLSISGTRLLEARVFYEESTYHLLVSVRGERNSPTSIYEAVSIDGLHFSPLLEILTPKPLACSTTATTIGEMRTLTMTTCSPGEWDGVWMTAPTVINGDNRLVMYYFGSDRDGFRGAVGLAIYDKASVLTRTSANTFLKPVTVLSAVSTSTHELPREGPSVLDYVVLIVIFLGMTLSAMFHLTRSTRRKRP